MYKDLPNTCEKEKRGVKEENTKIIIIIIIIIYSQFIPTKPYAHEKISALKMASPLRVKVPQLILPHKPLKLQLSHHPKKNLWEPCPFLWLWNHHR